MVTQDFLELHDLVGPSRTKVLSTVTAIYDVGCFMGAIAAFTIGERLGRRKALLLGTTIMSIGVILKTSSFSLAQMFVGRIVLGYVHVTAGSSGENELTGRTRIGNGINTSTAPVWQTETAPAKWRGKLVILEMATNIFGFMLVNWINYGLSFVGGGVAWRLPIALQFMFIFILFATIPWLPESPRYECTACSDKMNKVERGLTRLDGFWLTVVRRKLSKCSLASRTSPPMIHTL